jgi:hypothetical protein
MNGHRYINILCSQREVILQKFKNLSFPTQKITTSMNTYFKKYAIKHTHNLLDEVSKSYVQDAARLLRL